MIQEIITYMIIGSAVTLAVLKTVKKFGHTRKKEKTDYQKVKITDHNCSSCSAECMLRDVTSETIKKQDLCKKLDVESD